jgi:HSP20 family molecular chaperone IbpA
MHGNPMDMFDDMDEIFNRLFPGMDRRFMTDPLQKDGYRVIIRDDEEGEEQEETAFVRPANFEPTADVQRIGDEVKVVADLPGITTESLRLGIRNGKLVIDAGDADYHYSTSVALPPVDTASMQHSMKNGVLEVTFMSLPDQSGKA